MDLTVVDMGERPVLAGGKASRVDFYNLLRAAGAERLNGEIGKDKLLGMTKLANGEESVNFELRFREFSIGETNLVGRCTVEELEASIQAKWKLDVLKSLQDEQPEMMWELVAVRIWSRNIREVVERRAPAMGNAGGSVGFGAGAGAISTGLMAMREGNLMPQTRTYQEVPAYQAVWEGAFAGVGGNLVDMLNVHTSHDSPLAAYIRSREFRHLPPSLRIQRKAAVAVIERVYGDIVAVEAEVEADKVLTDLQVEFAGLLHQGGMKWTEIGTKLGVPWQTVRAAVVRTNGAADGPETAEG